MLSTLRSQREPPNRIARFFLWCSGSDLRALAELPKSETVKQVGYGTLVVVPAVLALFAMSYALSTLTDNRLVYLGAGLAWSAIVFGFDRFIVSTFRKSESTINDLTSTVFLSRLVFAAFVGVLIAHPMVMLYFDDSIEEALEATGRAKLAQIEASHEAKRRLLEDRVSILKTEIRERERERNEFQARLVEEIDGVVSGRTTGIPGRGASAAEKKLQLQVAQNELEAARNRDLDEIRDLDRRMAQIRLESGADRASFAQSTDYLARAGALEALAAEHRHVDVVRWFLIVFFVFVDTLPILFKGFTPRGPYDEHLQFAEYESSRTIQAERDSLDRVLYPHMVISSESRFVSDRNYEGIRDYTTRYRSFLEQLARHQEVFLAEWRRQHEVLARLDDEDLRRSQETYMGKLRSSSSEILERAVEQFQRSVAFDSRQQEDRTSAT